MIRKMLPFGLLLVFAVYGYSQTSATTAMAKETKTSQTTPTCGKFVDKNGDGICDNRESCAQSKGNSDCCGKGMQYCKGKSDCQGKGNCCGTGSGTGCCKGNGNGNGCQHRHGNGNQTTVPDKTTAPTK